MTDERGNTTNLVWGLYSNLAQRIDPDGTVAQFTHDGVGRITTTTIGY